MEKLQRGSAIPLQNVKIDSPFWNKYVHLVRDTMLPYQWEALNDRIPDASPSYAMHNFRVAAGLEEGDFQGMVFQDSDLAKWLEAVGYSLQTHPDPKLERIADETIDIIEKAQDKDGYLNTYFLIKEPDKRWTNLKDCHELYCAGHMIEAAVAYYKATGKDKLLKVVERLVDHIDAVIGPETGKLHGYPGHEEIELALIKLYRVTGKEKHLRLAKYFIDERGKSPNFFDMEWERLGRTSHWTVGQVPKPNNEYNQSHIPVREQEVAVGHAVRAVYLYAGMADVAIHTGDRDLFGVCKRLWRNIVKKQMYITGAIGSTHHGEAFSFDYDLPNDTVYAETCASIGLIFFAHRMLKVEADREYADVIEKALYNIILASMSMDGRHFFYVNPLEVWPQASEKDPGKRHVKLVRQKWFGCACCPPNLARLLASLGQYVYTLAGDTLYVHLYIGGESLAEVGGTQFRLVQETNYPWDGKVTIRLKDLQDSTFPLALRIPGWCRKAEILVNGGKTHLPEIMDKGYAVIERTWSDGDTVVLEMGMPVEVVYAHPRVRENAWKAALQRGPLVYCLEEIDNGSNLPAISLCLDNLPRVSYDPDLMGGAMVLEGEATRLADSGDDSLLYRMSQPQVEHHRYKAVPYFLWGNRQPGEMVVWVRYS
jgi:DUF1680 family protein